MEEKGVKIHKTFVGEFMTSLEMAGFSITVLKLDSELKELLDAPANTPAFKVI
ncbi:dihydroxyacetone kinase [Clostridium beijerinckii]|nr:dihydroxyacetone kinase [Clostridium beijerinckii]NSA02039.1 dihydroxyacetone kinase [Clostridium beijerinckii]